MEGRIESLEAQRQEWADLARARKERIAELEGLCKDWARWALGFQHLGAIGRDLLERTHKSIRGEGDDGNG